PRSPTSTLFPYTTLFRSLSKSDSGEDERGARRLVVLSGVALAAQVAATDYGTDQAAAAGLWFVLGCLLLGLIYRKRSRTARVFRSEEHTSELQSRENLVC